MINSLINGYLNVITNLLTIVLSPINTFISTIFPNVDSLVSAFNILLATLGTGLEYFGYLLPPNFKSLLVMYIVFKLTWYNGIIAYSTIVLLYRVIQRIKFW